ncbi:hypothetical protein COCMIDRAFT_99896, partial [Bipolaris oryzae ATCC 44560]
IGVASTKAKCWRLSENITHGSEVLSCTRTYEYLHPGVYARQHAFGIDEASQPHDAHDILPHRDNPHTLPIVQPIHPSVVEYLIVPPAYKTSVGVYSVMCWRGKSCTTCNSSIDAHDPTTSQDPICGTSRLICICLMRLFHDLKKHLATS